ncbi:MAG: glycoside hydrolase family 15 protein [Actinobacteria bacterium]|nr:MAG: glycoside hydrolase family 15 protein [Actinomycetota bacterium]
MPQALHARSSFPPIADYAFLSDGEVAALVAPSGNVEWLCLPQFDSPSVFAAILDRDAGRFRFGPADVQVPAARRYLPGTLVLETTWKSRTGWLVVRDAITVGPWHHVKERAHRQRRPPSDWEADHVLVRTARCAQGTVEVTLECEPAFDYGAAKAEWRYEGSTYHQAVASGGESPVELTIDTDMRIGFEGSRASARTTLREGDTVYVSASWSEHGGPKSFHEAFQRMDSTSAYWREQLTHGDFPDHPWRAELERSALTLRGLTYAPSGAIASAPTTSLPRVPGGKRNYDSRYTFVRDGAFALWAGYSLGFDWEADDFFYFLAEHTQDGKGIRNMYGVSGEHELEERILEHLTGYENSRPVRVGNAAYKYEQHDVWGGLLDATYLHAKSRDKLPERIWPMVKLIVELAVENWRKPDRGIWASRGKPRHYTSSKVMCWVAADRGARLAELRDEGELVEAWDKTAAEIREDVCENALSERGVFTQHYETDALDASLLLMPLVRFLPGDDKRVEATVRAIADELVEDGLVLRQRPSGRFAVEGESYTVCSFWLVSALVEIGEIRRAREMFERLLALASPLGLYAEHIDPGSGRHLGNFPHTFTHLALVNAALHVIGAEGEPVGDPRLDRVTTA